MTEDHKYLVLRWDGDDMTGSGELIDVMRESGANTRTAANTTPLS